MYVENFAEALFAFVMAYPDSGNAHHPERVAQDFMQAPNEFNEADIAGAEQLRARGHARRAQADLLGDVAEPVRSLLRESLCTEWRLFELPEADWQNTVAGALRNTLEAMDGIRHVGFSVATKLLYLKRPHLVPICDELVASRVMEGEPLRNIGEAMRCIERIRRIGQRNLELIAGVVGRLDAVLPDGDAYRDLSHPRALDAVIWFCEKQHRRLDYAALFSRG